MANKPLKKPSTAIDHIKTIASCIGLIMVGVTVTWIIMSQTTPLRDELKDSKKRYLELTRENEDLKKRKDSQPANENLVKENTNLKNELNKIKIDYEKVKIQLVQMMAENKTLSSKINNIYQEYNKLKKRDEESIQHYLDEYEKLRRKMKGIPDETLPKNNKKDIKTAEEKYVFINNTTGFFNNSIFITLRSIHGKDKITAIVHSSGYQEMTVDNEVAGKTLIYNSNNIYEIRIMGINPDYNNGAAKFLISIR